MVLREAENAGCIPEASMARAGCLAGPSPTAQLSVLIGLENGADSQVENRGGHGQHVVLQPGWGQQGPGEGEVLRALTTGSQQAI